MQRTFTPIIILFFLVIYLIFASNNSSIDAYYYAASIKHSGELFHPHHLLYNFTGYLCLKIIQGIGISSDVLTLLKIINALVAVGCLLLFNRLLLRMEKNSGEIAGFLIIAASSFAFWRYATENETYIFPLAFSLAASLGFLNYLKERRSRYLFVAGIFSCVAVLYHQIHLLWWFGLFIGIILQTKKWKEIFLFTLPVLLVPLVYIIVFIVLTNRGVINVNLIRFVLRDFYTGGVNMSFDWSNLYLTGINFIRSYIQVHGLIFLLMKKSVLYVLPGILAVTLAVSALVQHKCITGNAKGMNGIFIKTHGSIFGLQLLLALFAVGNAEFMVMLPILSFLIIAGIYDVNKRFLYIAGIGLFVWNISYGIIPLWKVDQTQHQQIIEWVDTHNRDLFILNEDQHIISKIYYSSGKEEVPNIQKSPEHMVSRGQSLSLLVDRIDSSFAKGDRVFTDCIDRPKIISRDQLLSQGFNQDFFSRYLSIPIDSVTSVGGTYYLYEIFTKDSPD